MLFYIKETTKNTHYKILKKLKKLKTEKKEK